MTRLSHGANNCLLFPNHLATLFTKQRTTAENGTESTEREDLEREYAIAEVAYHEALERLSHLERECDEAFREVGEGEKLGRTNSPTLKKT